MKFYHRKVILEISDSVYEPQEDSLLLAEILERYKLAGKKCLDMGCGSGLLAILMAKKGAKVIACDVNPEAIKITASNAKANNVKIKTIKSDLFSALNDSYDFIIFNPPYLPAENLEGQSSSRFRRTKFSEDTHQHKEQWSGGKTGRDIIEKFLQELPKHFNKNGKSLMVFSSLTGEKEVRKLCEKNDIFFRILKREKIPWEKLILAELSK